ncbi:glycosyltransferase [Acetobacter malorum]|uniref:glycosyltransferase n=1 Tax=Acetobacter malorum TaxID=178901 RepID=UPI0039EB669E
MAQSDKTQGALSGFVTQEDRDAWQEWASARAQETFQKGNDAWLAGRDAEAWNWLERANRQARDNPHVMLALALARQAVGDVAGAIDLLNALLERFDFREGWVLLATFQQALGNGGAAVSALGRVLSQFACTPDSAKLADKITHLNGLAGWCGLQGDGTLVLGGAVAKQTPVVWLDGQPVKVARKKAGWVCPSGWKLARSLDVRLVDLPFLVGNPVQPHALARSEGLVEAGPDGLSGWVWLPHDADRVPVVQIQDVRTGKTLHTIKAETLSNSVNSDVPLARYRALAFPAEALPDSPVRVVGPDGRDLAGSPLDVGLERRSARQVVQALAQTFSIEKKKKGKTGQDFPGFVPVPVQDEVTATPQVSGRQAEVAIVIPIYRDKARTLACLESVRQTISARKIPVVIVNDAAPDPDLVLVVEALAAQAGFRILTHTRNCGFPSAVNTGLRAVSGHDVILLNSDTLVAEGWVEELRRIAYASEETGTVTPFSNDASILSYPSSDKKNPVPDLAQTQDFMAQAQAANAGQAAEIPTANGFCMYVRHDCLAQTGVLRDDIFAQGYGEENDFCMRARALGWRHQAALGAYVAHVGSASFGGTRTGLMRRNEAILNRLHPGYHEMIAAWIEKDPLFKARRRFDLVRFRANAPHSTTSARKSRKRRATVLVTHDYGGGVERVVGERVKALSRQGLRPLVLRPTGGGCLLEDGRADADTYASLRFRLPEEWTLLTRLLKAEGAEGVEVHHMAGHNPMLYGLPDALDCPYTVHIHDYMWFCQRISLMGLNDRYCGEPDVAGCETCIALLGRKIEEDVPVEFYRTRAAKFLKTAQNVYAPSHDTAMRMQKQYPGLTCHVQRLENDAVLCAEGEALVRATLPVPEERVPGVAVMGAGRGERIRVCVIGGIGKEKGYDVLLAAARDAALRALPLEFVIVGHTPDDETLVRTGHVFITGEYQEDEAVPLIASLQADYAFLPSVWPETWCFTLGLAWKAGLKVVAFDLGAPAERIRATKQGILLETDLLEEGLNDVLLQLGRSGALRA